MKRPAARQSLSCDGHIAGGQATSRFLILLLFQLMGEGGVMCEHQPLPVDKRMVVTQSAEMVMKGRESRKSKSLPYFL
ncbi:hypothetical protein NDU88_004198 [Pleurodeles waltl]|uniref:Uncharacterized protein n=1 Tax=Pleurodeles waltl TaxID=8319 RepID=A0AAV7L607_PLEWA|nr:hypothetical protein NDU88_004198 [Pleurodeles waltl]